jgi:hypothetical protein
MTDKLEFSKEWVEFWENEYLKQIYDNLKINFQKMLDGLFTKEEIRSDWEDYWGKETSMLARGSERIYFWLFNQLGKPNSAPVGGDLFFETYNAYIHIDIKTVTTANIGDFVGNIFVGDNQNSWDGEIIVNNKPTRKYRGHLPTVYTKTDGTKKVCLTYFIIILADNDGVLQNIILTCIPNGILKNVYKDINVISAGKNPGKIRYNYIKLDKFKLLINQSRIKIVYWNFHYNFHVLNQIVHLSTDLAYL